MERMTAASPHFIRCIKPNHDKVPALISALINHLKNKTQLISRILPQVLSSFHLFAFLFQISDSFDLKYVREQVKVTGCCFT